MNTIQNYGMVNYSLRFKGKEKAVEKSATPLNENRPVAVSADKVLVMFKGGKNLQLTPGVKKIADESLVKIKRLGLFVDEEAQKIAERSIELSNRWSVASKNEKIKLMKERSELDRELEEKGYDYIEGHTPIKLSAQTNEALLNLIEKYRPKYGLSYVYETASQILRERGAM